MLTFLTTAFIILMMFFHASNKSTLINNEKKILSLHADRQIAYLEREFNQNKRDISLLSRSPYLDRFIDSVEGRDIRSEKSKEKDNLEHEFIRLIESRDEYHQIRLIGVNNNGREIIRVNQNKGGSEIVPFRHLQEKGNSRYYQETIKLPSGSYYISDIELNREHGVIEKPETYVIRVSAPIYTQIGKLFGIIVINIDFSIPLFNLTQYLDEGEEFILVNSDKSTINLDINSITPTDQSNTSAVDKVRKRKYQRSINVVDSVVSQNRLYLDNGRYLTFILSKPVDLILNDGSGMIDDYELVITVIFLAIIWGLVFIARSPLKQITNICKIIQGITSGTHQRIELPIDQRNEVGDLSRAFNKLLNNIEKTRDELTLSNERLELAITGSSDGIWDWNVRTNQFDLSERYKKMLGYNNENFKSDRESLLELVHPDDLNRLLKLNVDYVEGKIDKYNIEFRMRHKDGHYIDILSRGNAVRDDSGRATRVVGTNTDVTERNKDIKRRVQYEQNQKQALVREVHHRIKNNLQGVASLLRQHAEFNPPVRDQLEAAIAQVYTMAVVHGLQGKGDEGVFVINMLKEIINIVGDITGTNIIFKGDNTHSQYSIIEKEAVPMALIISELITNACKHSRDDSSVSVSVGCNWCLDDSILIEMTNRVDSFPKELSIDEKEGLGTGLNLVVSLLPPEGASLNIHEKDGICTTKLVLKFPLLYVRCDWNIKEAMQI